MLYYDRIDKSKGIYFAKSNNNKECMICYYWFFNHGFKFQAYVCNVCHCQCCVLIKIKYCLKFQSIQSRFSFFFSFLFSIYKIVDSMDNYKSLNINIGTVMKSLEMLKFVPDILKLKKKL